MSTHGRGFTLIELLVGIAFFGERRRGNGNPVPRSDPFQTTDATSLTAT